MSHQKETDMTDQLAQLIRHRDSLRAEIHDLETRHRGVRPSWVSTEIGMASANLSAVESQIASLEQNEGQ